MIELLYLLRFLSILTISIMIGVIIFDAIYSYCNKKKSKSKPYYDYRTLRKEDEKWKNAVIASVGTSATAYFLNRIWTRIISARYIFPIIPQKKGRHKMIEDKENIKALVKMMDVNVLIDVLFEEEVIATITTPTLVNHLLENLTPSELFIEALECATPKDGNIRTNVIDGVKEVMVTYGVSTIEVWT